VGWYEGRCLEGRGGAGLYERVRVRGDTVRGLGLLRRPGQVGLLRDKGSALVWGLPRASAHQAGRRGVGVVRGEGPRLRHVRACLDGQDGFGVVWKEGYALVRGFRGLEVSKKEWVRW
jgi:hypothetical protein